MSEKKYVLALDEGTSSARAILFDRNGEIASIGQQEFRQIYPNPGWVEHDPQEIWTTQLGVIRDAMKGAKAKFVEVAAIGITNQRETVVVWDRKTGRPIHNALVWQDRRTAEICDAMKERGLEALIREKTGLVIDAYFSGTKIAWILDNVEGARARAEKGELAVGTIDSWLIWNLTGGKVHVTDVSNASRTQLMDIRSCKWDQQLMDEIRVPCAVLPKIKDTSEVYGTTDPAIFDGEEIPVASAVGDQQGALFGQACFEAGMVKATYGTGGSLMMNVGDKPKYSDNGLLTTVACRVNGKVDYAVEGLLFTVGSVIQWLRDELQIIHNAAESELSAKAVPDTNGVYIVPAFTGLSAPHWDQYARGTIVGITRGTNRDHIVRAALESMAYQIRDVIDCMQKDTGIELADLKVDGGAAMNDFVLQFQADQLNVSVLRPTIVDSTARGAAFLAGLAVGFWQDKSALRETFTLDEQFDPKVDRATADKLYAGWLKATDRARDWEEHA
ncbi:glycerol kinase GlpK [Gymnodinialimonas hymeniacidonis]|uniref:glycerol kinase GlpK n=1 Tax=Gymnodinialimonas hymeniacidonis TaxID=3126508 RepID=UPI0034C61209